MKLYYAPGACSMAPHIVAREAGHIFDLERVDIPNKKTADGGDYWKINPKGYVPALMLDDGQVLTEVADRRLVDHRRLARNCARNAAQHLGNRYAQKIHCRAVDEDH